MGRIGQGCDQPPCPIIPTAKPLVTPEGRGTEATLIDAQLFLPGRWTADPERCQAAGIPAEQRGFFLPRRDTTLEEVLRQMEVRHRKRQAAIDSAHRRQLRE